MSFGTVKNILKKKKKKEMRFLSRKLYEEKKIREQVVLLVVIFLFIVFHSLWGKLEETEKKEQVPWNCHRMKVRSDKVHKDMHAYWIQGELELKN